MPAQPESTSIEVRRLRAAPQNANVMTDPTYLSLREAIRQFGFNQPITVRPHPTEDGAWEIVDGHHRLRAAMDLGMIEVPCLVVDLEHDPRLVALSMNRLRGETDLAVAGLVVADLVDTDVSQELLMLAGFSEHELAHLIAAVDSDDDRVTLDDVREMDAPREQEERVAKPFVLELTFATREDLARAKKALRKAAGGKGRELSDGLLRLVDAT